MAVVRGPGLQGHWNAALYSPHQLVPPLTVPLGAEAENRTGLDDSAHHRCGTPHFMSDWACPPPCGFLEPVEGEEVCSFRCVPRCGIDGGHLAWEDVEKKVCTRCPLPGCMLCSSQDSCEQCYMSWAYVFSKGARRCVLRLWHLSIVFIVLLMIPVCVVASWYASLHCRPVVNDDVRARAVIHSDRLKLRDHRRHSHNWYPLRANLFKPDERGNAIGGLGLALHFRFQLAALAWTVIALFTWLLVVSFKKELLTLGSGRGISLVIDPAQVYRLCNTSKVDVMIARRERIQGEAIMLAYTSILYIVTTVGALVFASHQRSFFTRLAAKVTTMQDYALFLSGFPEEAGESVEEERADFVREVCGQTPVGVSVCWDFEDCEAELMAILRRETFLRQRAQSRDSIRAADLIHAKSMYMRTSAQDDTSFHVAAEDPCLRFRGCCRRLLLSARTQLGKIDPLFLPGPCPEESLSFDIQAQAKRLLEDISSTEHTCAVFGSVQERDIARERFNVGGPATMFKGRHRVWASGMEQDTEPDTVLWSFLGTARASRRRKVALSILKIVLAIALWAGFLYLPWGYYVALHMETFGQLPSFATEAVFSMLVVLGNQLIYFLCNKAARSVAYNHTGEQEALYMFLYSIAILVNMAVDLFVIRWTSVKALDQFDMNVPMESLRHFMSYRLWKYNFPSCFLIPFMVEPMVLYILPFDLATRLIGTRGMGQSEADEILQPAPMDLSRYQDILLNLTQAVCALFLEPQYVLRTWIGLIVGQLFILCWDHFKVLRVVRAFNFSSFLSERVSQRLTALPCGMLGACVAYRYLHLRSLIAKQQECGYCQGEANVFTMQNFPYAMLVLVLHVGVHLLVLHRTVPMLKVAAASEDAWTPSYKEIATERPANYFNTNPVHCLRSRYLHDDSPPCNFYIRGKEHLLEANPEIGQYYHARRWDDKRKTFAVEMSFVTKNFRQSWKKEPAIPRAVSSENAAGAVVVAGQLWKLCHHSAELFLAEHHRHFHLRPSAAPSASSHRGPGAGGPPPGGGHHQTLAGGVLAEGAPPWTSLAGWRFRFVSLRDDGEGSGELAYCSEKSEHEVVACTLSRRDSTMRVQPLPRVELEPVPATSQRETRLAIRSYELAFMLSTVEPGLAHSDRSLPCELHPMAITWTDRTGADRHLVLAHEKEECFMEWLHHIRSFCGNGVS